MSSLEPVAGKPDTEATTPIIAEWAFPPPVEERLLGVFERRLAEMTPEEQERAVTAALAVGVRDKAPRT